MSEFRSITRYEIEQALTPAQLRVLQILSIAMLMGPLVLSGFVFYLNSLKIQADFPSEISETMQILIYIVIAVSLVFYFIVYNFRNIFASSKALKNRIKNFNPSMDKAERAIIITGIDLQFMIIRYALLEGVSLFAIAILFIELQNSEYQLPSDLWLLLIPFMIFIIYILQNFPTKNKTLDRIENDILNRLRD